MDDSTNLSSMGTKERLSEIKKQVRSLDLRLSGWVWDADGNKFRYVGKPLASTITICKATGLLEPFSQDSNLITSKDRYGFERQFYDVCKSFNQTLLLETGSLAENYNVVFSMFKNTLDNIGDIILGSKEVVKSTFGSDVQEEDRSIGGL